jgi:hypothetical protein
MYKNRDRCEKGFFLKARLHRHVHCKINPNYRLGEALPWPGDGRFSACFGGLKEGRLPKAWKQSTLLSSGIVG